MLRRFIAKRKAKRAAKLYTVRPLEEEIEQSENIIQDDIKDLNDDLKDEFDDLYDDFTTFAKQIDESKRVKSKIFKPPKVKHKPKYI